ncbi:hypothetical protein [Sporichthya sp.]|uniref:hypothetical protein n=1 Tax=Sporichthya sp. TaxID=65475 RepID=UPI0017DC401C|nr:hypothetical protein [Sporichthya sp.]MBA3741350.1 hypothetical protein [Sporichthya sp.]
MLSERARNVIGALGGIAPALLFAFGWACWRLPGRPDYGNAVEVQQGLVDHTGACRAAATLGCLSLFALIWFEARLYSILRAAEGGDGMVTRVFFAALLHPDRLRAPRGLGDQQRSAGGLRPAGRAVDLDGCDVGVPAWPALPSRPG